MKLIWHSIKQHLYSAIQFPKHIKAMDHEDISSSHQTPTAKAQLHYI